MKKRDYVSVVETAYSFEGDAQAWMERVVHAAGPMIDVGLGYTGYCFEHRDTCGTVLSTTPVGVGPEGWFGALMGMAEAMGAPEVARNAFFVGKPVATFSSIVGGSMFETYRPGFEKFCHPLGIHDLLGIRGMDARKRGAILIAPLAKESKAAPRTVWAWNRVAAHLAAALRARDGLTHGTGDVVATSDAVLSPGGKVLHAERDATRAASRSALSAAALAIARSRSNMRRMDPEGALDIWKALVDGKWSIVDHHDRDGRRFLLARRNDPKLRDPQALSPEERQVAAYAALGHAGHLISYELGLAPQTVSDHLRNAMRKLRVRSRSELAQLFSPSQSEGS